MMESLLRWCREQQEALRQQLSLMESGKLRMHEVRLSGQIDTTNNAIERTKAHLRELEKLLAEHSQ